MHEHNKNVLFLHENIQVHSTYTYDTIMHNSYYVAITLTIAELFSIPPFHFSDHQSSYDYLCISICTHSIIMMPKLYLLSMNTINFNCTVTFTSSHQVNNVHTHVYYYVASHNCTAFLKSSNSHFRPSKSRLLRLPL